MNIVRGVILLIICVIVLRFVLRWYFRRAQYGTSRDLHEMLRIMRESDRMAHRYKKQIGAAKKQEQKAVRREEKAEAKAAKLEERAAKMVAKKEQKEAEKETETSVSKKLPGISLLKKDKSETPTYNNWMEEQLAIEKSTKRDLDHLFDGD